MFAESLSLCRRVLRSLRLVSSLCTPYPPITSEHMSPIMGRTFYNGTVMPLFCSENFFPYSHKALRRRFSQTAWLRHMPKKCPLRKVERTTEGRRGERGEDGANSWGLERGGGSCAPALPRRHSLLSRIRIPPLYSLNPVLFQYNVGIDPLLQ